MMRYTEQFREARLAAPVGNYTALIFSMMTAGSGGFW